MTVNERLMATGDWELEFRRDTPHAIRRAVDLQLFGFGHIVVTSAAIDIAGMTDVEILPLARFVGIFRKRPDEYTIGGCGLNAWLGDEDGKGPVLTAATGSNWTFNQWRLALCPTWLTVKTGLGTPAGSYDRSFIRVGYREAIEEVCNRFDAEYRVNNLFEFEMGTASSIFNDTPTSMIVRRNPGRDYSYRILLGQVTHEADLEDWTRQVHYYTGTEDVPVLNSAAIAGTVYFKAPDGSPIVVDRIIEDFSGSADGSALAAAQLGRFDHAREDITLTGIDYDIGDSVRVGDSVHVFDPEQGIYDVNTPRAFRGSWVYPLTLRLVGHTWPVRAGMGVYFRRFQVGSSTPEYVDLTRWIEWETGSDRVEVGDSPRLLTL